MECMSAGMDYFIVKPVNLKSIYSVLKQILISQNRLIPPPTTIPSSDPSQEPETSPLPQAELYESPKI